VVGAGYGGGGGALDGTGPLWIPPREPWGGAYKIPFLRGGMGTPAARRRPHEMTLVSG